MKKLYLIEQTGNIGWDEYLGFVIAADSDIEARDVASQRAADEGADTWLSTTMSSCSEIGVTDRGDGVVLSSFNAG